MRGRAQFAAEIRTPIVGIIGLSDLLLESGLDGRQRQYASALREAAADLLRRVDAAADAAGHRFGDGTSERYEFHLLDALNTGVNCCASLARSHAVSVSLECDPKLPGTIVADGRRLVQLISEMLASAVVHNDTGAARLRAFLDRPDTLLLDIGPVDPEVRNWFGSELASILSARLEFKREAGGMMRCVSRIPIG